LCTSLHLYIITNTLNSNFNVPSLISIYHHSITLRHYHRYIIINCQLTIIIMPPHMIVTAPLYYYYIHFHHNWELYSTTIIYNTHTTHHNIPSLMSLSNRSHVSVNAKYVHSTTVHLKDITTPIIMNK